MLDFLLLEKIELKQYFDLSKDSTTITLVLLITLTPALLIIFI